MCVYIWRVFRHQSRLLRLCLVSEAWCVLWHSSLIIYMPNIVNNKNNKTIIIKQINNKTNPLPSYVYWISTNSNWKGKTCLTTTFHKIEIFFYCYCFTFCKWVKPFILLYIWWVFRHRSRLLLCLTSEIPGLLVAFYSWWTPVYICQHTMHSQGSVYVLLLINKPGFSVAMLLVCLIRRSLMCRLQFKRKKKHHAQRLAINYCFLNSLC